jgi:hypothetical protein
MSTPVLLNRLGSVSVADFERFNSLTISSQEYLTFSTNETYSGWQFNEPNFSLHLLRTISLPESDISLSGIQQKCLPIDSDGQYYAYLVGSGIYIYWAPGGQLYTLVARTNNLTLYGFDATSNGYIAYSAHSQGQTSQGVSYNYKYVSFGKLNEFEPYNSFNQSKTYGANNDFAGNCSLSRNGTYCVVYGSYNSLKTISVFQGVSGPETVRVGENITLPDSTLYSVKINNTGTRVVALSQTTIRTYDLISGAWVEAGSAINFSQSTSQTSIALSADGSIEVCDVD